jgi:hypothetical protein
VHRAGHLARDQSLAVAYDGNAYAGFRGDA